MKRLIKKGSTDVTIDVWIPDSASTTGGGKTGLAFNTASLVCYYRRGATGAATALTLATQTVGGVHSDGGFVEIDATNMPGLYRLDLSDAIIATGVPYVTMMLKGAANMAPVAVELQLVDFDPESAASLGLSNLDAAVSSRASSTQATNIETDTQDIQARVPAALVGGRMAANAEVVGDKSGYALSSAGVLAIWDALTSALTTAGSIGKHLVDRIVGTLATGTHNPQSGDAFARLGAPAGASTSADIAAVKTVADGVKAKTDSLTFTVAGQADVNVQSVNDVTIEGAGTDVAPWKAQGT